MPILRCCMRMQLRLTGGSTVSIPLKWWSRESWDRMSEASFATGTEKGVFFEYIFLPNGLGFKVHTTFRLSRSKYLPPNSYISTVKCEQLSSAEIRSIEWGPSPHEWVISTNPNNTVWLDTLNKAP